MINTQLKIYDYALYEEENDYGQPVLGDIKGQIKMAINITAQGTQDNVLYKDCSYVGLTQDANVDDTYVIEYGKGKLKVLYVNPKGRYKQVFMGEI